MHGRVFAYGRVFQDVPLADGDADFVHGRGFREAGRAQFMEPVHTMSEDEAWHREASDYGESEVEAWSEGDSLQHGGQEHARSIRYRVAAALAHHRDCDISPVLKEVHGYQPDLLSQVNRINHWNDNDWLTSQVVECIIAAGRAISEQGEREMHGAWADFMTRTAGSTREAYRRELQDFMHDVKHRVQQHLIS